MHTYTFICSLRTGSIVECAVSFYPCKAGIVMRYGLPLSAKSGFKLPVNKRKASDTSFLGGDFSSAGLGLRYLHWNTYGLLLMIEGPVASV